VSHVLGCESNSLVLCELSDGSNSKCFLHAL